MPAASAAASAPAGVLVVNADDFGETEPITAGITECIEAGAVTSTTILANMPATKRALAWAAPRSRDRRASFGVHLNLCEGRPLTAARSLVDSGGRFRNKRAQAVCALLGRLDPDDVAQELRAQIDLVRDAGVEISHLDGHKHLHQLPGVGAVVARLAAERGIERVRCTIEAGSSPPGTGVAGALSRAVRQRLARRFSSEARARGLRHPARTVALAQVMAVAGDDARAALLRAPGAATEMFCHPGDARADADKPGSASRHDELRFLTSGALPRLCALASVRLASFWDV